MTKDQMRSIEEALDLALERKPVCWEGEDKCPNRQACCDAQHCLYTTPAAAQRQWVGLTDEEVEEVWKRVEASDFRDVVQPFAQAIEVALRSRNENNN